MTGMAAPAVGLATLLADARALSEEIDRSEDDGQRVAERLHRSVIRPLGVALGIDADINDATAAGSAASGSWVEQVARLAARATRLRIEPQASPALLEATAALQDLVAELAPDLLKTLASLQKRLPASIVTAVDGPLLVTNAAVVDWLGVPLPARPQLALCRCGQSKTKPLCDGSHAEVGFRDAKDPNRVPDQQDSYPGQQLAVLDNRGLCAHSGFCSDRLATVFHADSTPFVTPSGGRMDEIIRAVRACPSGALSYAVDGREARAQVDQPREAAIEVSKDGPYRVTGAIDLFDAAGAAADRPAGASLEHYSLCRCGMSQNKPFCSGMHWQTSFRDPEPPTDREPTLFEWVGGFTALTRLTRRFYEKYVPEDPLLAPLFANMQPDHPERVAAWLGETFGGPDLYSERYGGYARMVGQHLNKALIEEQRVRWVALMARAADDVDLPRDPEFRAAFVSYLEWGSRIAKENSTPGAKPPLQMPVPRWWWVCHAAPGTRQSAVETQSEPKEDPVTLPAASESLSFAAHIKPLFRESDRRAMSFAFDLWSYDDVSTHADAVRARLESGSMPCDGAWPADRLAVFARWVESGKPA